MPAIPTTGSGGSVPQVHHDAVAARTVFVAPHRADRPGDADLAGARLVGNRAATAPPAGRAAGGRDWCPFCVGNESRTPPAVLRAPRDEALPWLARIVPNLYPFTVDAGQAAALPAASQPRQPVTSASCRPAHGVHDVVIEAAAHESSVLAVPPAAWREVWELVRRRLEDLAGRADLAWAMVFKNSGPRAGASLAHLHSQLVALDFTPPVIAAELAAATTMTTAFARLLNEARAGGRVVAERGGLVAMVPPAPRQPFETWILPHTPQTFFHDAPAADVAALADLTQWFVARLGRLAPEADYNWWLHQPPFRVRSGQPAPATTGWHWHLEILPRLAQFAGFELGTGCHVTTVTPEDSARMLRDA
jgi:UDPglucose--hexose-1-phosphate uridylyltransferase